MIPRLLKNELTEALNAMPTVALLGPRQVGKTTLALDVAGSVMNKETAYLDLELETDLAKLDDAEAYLRRFADKLLIIDEVQLKAGLFRTLRGLVDIRKRAGERAGHFLLLGSASRDLLQQSSESLAGRIRYLELKPFSILEIHGTDPPGFNVDKLWLRGGFPDSYLADNDAGSWAWRSDFLTTYLERDIPRLGLRLPAIRMRRFWTMLAHVNGQQINLSALGKSLETSHTSIRNYLDVLTDLYMVRQIPTWSGNTKKRLVKSPKIYLRDTGLLHRLLNVSDYEMLLGSPYAGSSWEGFVVENIVAALSDQWRYSYYRTAAQAEIDLVLEGPRREVWAIEIKRSSAPKARKGFHSACGDIGANRKFVVYGGTERFPLAADTEAVGIVELLQMMGTA
jgi:hypothetical protein